MPEYWTRLMTEKDATRRSRFNPDKILSNDDTKCQHTWLRYSGFDRCPHCGLMS